MNRILLVRHATTELQGKLLYGRMPGVKLSEHGYLEVERLADGLSAHYEIGKVVSSPLERAQETARAIAERAGVRVVETDERLTELDHGAWVGKTFEELHGLEEWKTYNRHRATMCAPGGESTLAAQVRAWAALEELRNGHTGETVVVVSHGDIVRALLILLLGMPLDNILRLEVQPASASEIVFHPGGAIVQNINRIFR